ncbi:hypothetical protein EVAR_82925_1 [Eumeta japonica]|uniref:Uncharacterized protein n=1 Tax=Eumeta variegata TaxID=151549 RepID=A0A4C1X221_EUMVA|nr:hypothetical protein EVAR_82925_1 [Eumeta japonica]
MEEFQRAFFILDYNLTNARQVTVLIKPAGGARTTSANSAFVTPVFDVNSLNFPDDINKVRFNYHEQQSAIIIRGDWLCELLGNIPILRDPYFTALPSPRPRKSRSGLSPSDTPFLLKRPSQFLLTLRESMGDGDHMLSGGSHA